MKWNLKIFLMVLGLFLICWVAPTVALEKPNVVVFLTDDQGWGDLGCYGHPRIQSPHLDEFASQGLRLTQCYSACSVCSPSRSAILTGRTPYRNGVWRWIPAGSQYHLRTSEITIAELLKANGYDTCHVGKWHLNGKFNSPEQPQPNDHGYDHWMATQNNAAPHHMNPTNFVRNGEALGRANGPSSVVCAEEAVHWLQARKDKQRPFFLTVWTHEPHLPIESAEKYMRPYEDLDDEGIRQHHGNITQLDDAFGRLMTGLDQMGYRDNTLVIFTSDNGPEGKGTSGRTRGSTGGLRGRKRSSHEGGIRVPGLIRWPGHVEPGTESDEPVIGSDIFSTLCAIVDIPLPADRTIDGASLLPLFRGRPVERTEPLYWRNHLAPAESRVAMRVGDWKILGSDDLQRFELYNMRDDWQEKTDLKSKHPEKFEQLKRQLIEMDAAVLKEGPDWWKHDPPRRKKVKPTKALSPGTDQTGSFDEVLGGEVATGELGFHLKATGEGLAVRQLDQPITGRAVLRTSYRSLQKKGKTRNAAIVLGSRANNDATLKIGTAIGMNRHVAFTGDWQNVGNQANVAADFQPMDLFEVTIDLDLEQHLAKATINQETFQFRLPPSMTEISWVGFYVKATESDFSELVITKR
ncbi:MAG: sulfatase-like hydrolase/transferase [Mariniblastus sp.]|nr:sulfatase-like hydrolase/transferase [Mariniblastus sp.]